MMTAFLRTLLLYLLLLAGLRLMGKRQIGELETPELVLALLVSDLAVVPMQDFGIPLIYGIIPIITLMSTAMLLSYGNLKSLRFRTLLCGEPTLIIQDGTLLQQAMRANRFTVDELLEELRRQGVCDLQTVQYAVLETSGQLSVLLRSQSQPLTAEQIRLSVPETAHLPVILINDGRLLRQALRQCGKDTEWLTQILEEHGCRSHREVFLLTLDGGGKIFLLRKETAREERSA